MIDFLRLISPYLYTMIPILLVIIITFTIILKKADPDVKPVAKKVYRWLIFIVLLIFSIAVIRMVMINEVPRSDVDHSVKKERSNYSIEQAKKDTVTVK